MVMSKLPENTFQPNSYIARVSRRLIASYLLDWITVAALIGIGVGFNHLDARHHVFSLVDPAISFPHIEPETVSDTVLVIVSCLAPAVIIIVICLIFVPGPTVSRRTPKELIWRRKLWETHTGLLGLAVAVSGAYFITEGLKDLFGKPRPDFISRCDPDLSNIRAHIVSGLNNFLNEAPPVVSWTICRERGKKVSHDGFASFPSGHSSFSWSGLGYLTLFLCAKFNIAIPFLAPRPYTKIEPSTVDELKSTSTEEPHGIPLRNQAAAPPVPHLILALIPVATAAYISATRWGDYRHQGFDIIVGSLLGAVMAWLGFRWYHLPIQRGSGWSWGARTRKRAFGVEVGVSTYVGDEGWEREKLASARRNERDLEEGIEYDNERGSEAQASSS